MKHVLFAALVTLAQTLAAQQVSINSGLATGGYASVDGTSWGVDQYYSGGDGLYTSNAIAGTADPGLYRTARYALYANFGYKIPVANGQYNVTLKFAEIRYSAKGQRVFNVAINGSPVLTNFDILATTKPNTALDQSFSVTVTNGVVDIGFTGVVNGGIVNAIQINPATTPTLTAAPTSLSFSGAAGGTIAGQTLNLAGTPNAITWTVSGVPSWLTLTIPTQSTPSAIVVTPNPAGMAAGTYNATIVFSPTAGGSSLSAPVSLTVSATQPGTTPTIQLDSGFTTTPYTAVDGSKWQLDAYYSGGDGLYTGSPIRGTSDPLLYRTARQGLYSDFSYQIPVTNGTYYVTLKFAEIKYATQGQRVFNVAINGNPVLSNFDILSETSPFSAIDKTFPVTVSNNAIKIEFIGVVNRGIVNAILVSSTPQTSPSPTLSISAPSSSVVSGQTLQFTATQSNPTGTPAVTWSAAQGTISASGLYTPPAVAVNTGVVVSAQSTSSPPLSAQTTITVVPATAAPTLTVAPASLAYSATTNGSAVTKTIAIQSNGALNWSVSGAPAWLSLSANSGSTPATVTATASPAGLNPATYNATLSISTGSGSPTQVPVSFAVTGTSNPVISISPGTLSFVGAVGATLAPQLLNVQNASGSVLNWTAAASPSWLTLSAASGATPGTVTVTANTSTLSAGTVNGSITFSAPGATGSPYTVPVSVTLTTSGGSQFYVSPTGSSSGNGSITNPWDLQTALSQPAAVKAGSTIWLRGGVYGNGTTSEFTSVLAGTAGAPIIVKQYPGERATVNGGISVNGPYTWYWGFEIMSTNPDRAQGAVRQECMDTYPGSTGVKVINMVLHDCLQGIGFWAGAIDAEMNGNLLYFNGETGTSRGVGHAIYTQNQTGTKTINDNIFFDTFDIGFQAYGSGNAFAQNYSLDGNVSFNNGSPVGVHVDNILFAVGSGLDNISVKNSYTYHTPADNAGYSRLGWQFGSNNNGSLTATGNYWIGGGGGEASIEMWGWNKITYQNNVHYATQASMLMLHPGGLGTANYAIDNNQYFGSGLISLSGSLGGLPMMKSAGFDAHSTFSSGRPTGTWSFVRPNKYEAGRANIVLYNWGLLPSVSVDLSTVLNVGDPYVIRDSENYYGTPVASGTFTGGAVAIPMAGLTKAVPVGYKALPHTAPEFGVFIVSRQ